MEPSFSYFCSSSIVNPTCPQSSILQLLQKGTPSWVSTIISWPSVLSYRTAYLLRTNCFMIMGLLEVDILSSEPNQCINASVPLSRVSKCNANFEIPLFSVFAIFILLFSNNFIWSSFKCWSFEKHVALREYKDTSWSGHIYVLEQSSTLVTPSRNIALSTIALILSCERMLPLNHSDEALCTEER